MGCGRRRLGMSASSEKSNCSLIFFSITRFNEGICGWSRKAAKVMYCLLTLFARRQRHGSPVAEGCGVDGGRVRARGTLVFFVRYVHARKETSSPTCLYAEWTGLLCRANG